MKSQIMKRSVLRNLALSMLALFALTGAAYAQGAGSDLKAKDEADSKAAREYMDRMETDQKYQETIRSQQSTPTPTSNDPWGSVRQTTTPSVNPGAKPIAKTATGTKAASGANKAVAGSIKPAPGPAAAAAGTTPKGQ
jgi:hypothetical protein